MIQFNPSVPHAPGPGMVDVTLWVETMPRGEEEQSFQLLSPVVTLNGRPATLKEVVAALMDPVAVMPAARVVEDKSPSYRGVLEAHFTTE